MKRLVYAVTIGSMLLHGCALGQEPPAHVRVPSLIPPPSPAVPPPPPPVAAPPPPPVAAPPAFHLQAPAVAENAELMALREENLRLRRTIELLQSKVKLLEQ